MRNAFIEQLIDESLKNQKIFLLVGDLGYSVVEPFANQFPERYMNVGIAEQNMIGIASGLAIEGYTVFVYSIGNFPTLRPMEQIRYDVCYHNLNVKIVAVGGGYSYGPLGASHHATEEIGMLRTIPGITICAPGDPIETKWITKIISNVAGPVYLRIGKSGEPKVHENQPISNENKFLEIFSGMKTVVLSTGSMLGYSRQIIVNNKLPFGLFSVPFIKPLNLNDLLKISMDYEEIVTIEEHQKSCGFGSAILEGLNDLREMGKIDRIPKVTRKGITDRFYSISGSLDYLRNLAGINLDLLK